jgi:hypothetical protein
MAQTKLWNRYSIFRQLILVPLIMSTIACRADDKPVGMTLLFQSAGMPVGVLRFDPDGMRGPVPGAVGGIYPRGGAEMSFMPGDSKRGMPAFVDVKWMVATPEYDAEWKILSSRSDKYSKQWLRDVDAVNGKAPNYTKRIDLVNTITPELVAQVRADYKNTQLKLIITFNNDEVDIKAVAYKWR